MPNKPQQPQSNKPQSKWEKMAQQTDEELIETLKPAKAAHDRDLDKEDDTAEVAAEAAQEEAGEKEDIERITDVDELHVMLEDAQAKVKDYWDKVLRAQAEVDNIRRRSERDVSNARKFALDRFAKELLPVVDSLEHALAQPHEGDDKISAFIQGVEMTRNMFLQTLEKFAIKQINPEGEVFNPDFHEAIQTQETKDAAPNTVIKVMQRGYTLNERLIRPAMVIVSK